MAHEETFRSPGYYESETDLSTPAQSTPTGVPAGVIGTANKGPAFVPVTVGNFDEFSSVFGGLDITKYGPYVVNEFLKNRSSLTYLRVLGAGANETDADINNTVSTGRVTNAGVRIEGSLAADDSLGRHVGCVQFIGAVHDLQANEAYGLPMFTDNDSYTGSSVNLIRGMVLMASGARMLVMDGDESVVGAFSGGSNPDDFATLTSNKFKLVISSTLGNGFNNADGNPGVRVLTASLNPSDDDYYAKILNTNPDNFVSEQHLLYADFAVDSEIATATGVGMLSGSTHVSTDSGEPTLVMRNAFGGLDTRYRTPSTPSFISQPFGDTEYDLFSVEARDDGAYANTLYKVAITNVQASIDDSNKYGTFTIEIRSFDDTDSNKKVLESYPLCSLDPQSDHYVAKLVGDRRVYYNFDDPNESERRLIATGKYENVSSRIRVVMAAAVEDALVPAESLPFGFRGAELLKTNDLLTDTTDSDPRVVGDLGNAIGSGLSGSLLPPVPFRYKVTKGDTATAASWEGEPGHSELANPQLYWGVKYERNTSPLNPNVNSEKNGLLTSLTKFMGIKKLDVLVTGSGADTFNNNKFSLANVTLANTSISHITASISDHMREAAYIRNAVLDPTTHTYSDATLGSRITLATILATDTAANFNRFSRYTKFSTFMYGGYDGVNFLDKDARRMNDKASSFDTAGGAEASFLSPGLLSNSAGSGQSNSTVSSYKTAVNIMTDPLSVNVNILALPGIRDSFLTDYTMQKVRDYGFAYYVMDLPNYDSSDVRMYDDSSSHPDVDYTSTAFDSRVVDNNYVGTYFPDVHITDESNKRVVKLPASIAAMGALAFNDRVAYPWFAPAGFNRASLDFVKNVEVRLNVSDRARLDQARINAIATFPRMGFVIYTQRTLQIKKSALDKVNVRRMLLEVKRIIKNLAEKMTFEQNDAETRNKFVSQANQQLGLIEAQSGVERFDVIMNETNNTQQDADLNRINGTIVVVPTRTVEFIAMNFVITRTGVTFV